MPTPGTEAAIAVLTASTLFSGSFTLVIALITASCLLVLRKT
jgi:indole-3-glycerol phosphate synthase